MTTVTAHPPLSVEDLAETFVVGPGDVLVVRVREATQQELDALAAMLRERFGERFVVLTGDGLAQLGVVREVSADGVPVDA